MSEVSIAHEQQKQQRSRHIHYARRQRKLHDVRPGDLVLTASGLHRVGYDGRLWAFRGGATCSAS